MPQHYQKPQIVFVPSQPNATPVHVVQYEPISLRWYENIHILDFVDWIPRSVILVTALLLIPVIVMVFFGACVKYVGERTGLRTEYYDVAQDRHFR